MARQVTLLCLAFASCAGADPCAEEDAATIYERRIEPILVDDRPSSCNRCHLAGIDLSLYVQASPCQTMACMVDKQLVDLDAPDQSLVLDWISRSEPDSELITQKVIDEEYDGVKAWIDQVANCGDPDCDLGEWSDPCNDAAAAAVECEFHGADAQLYQDPGGCSDTTIEELYLNTVFAWRGRCYPCHWDGVDPQVLEDMELDIPEGLPKLFPAGECQSAALASLRIIERRGYIDMANPDQSLLIMKPLAESAGGLPHGGHDKFFPVENDLAWVQYAHFVQRLADCRTGSGA